MPYDTETIVEPKCPKCGGAMWNNVATKTNPKAPDFKCKDKGCDGVVWPPKTGARPAAPKPLTTSGKAPYSSGPALPYETQSETGAPPVHSAAVHAVAGTLDSLFTIYSVCLNHAIAVEVPKLVKADIGVDPETAHAIASTIFIAATRQERR